MLTARCQSPSHPQAREAETCCAFVSIGALRRNQHNVYIPSHCLERSGKLSASADKEWDVLVVERMRTTTELTTSRLRGDGLFAGDRWGAVPLIP